MAKDQDWVKSIKASAEEMKKRPGSVEAGPQTPFVGPTKYKPISKISYEQMKKFQNAGLGFGVYHGIPKDKKGGKISLKDCKVSTHEKNSKHKDW
jgi:hypothetical protein